MGDLPPISLHTTAQLLIAARSGPDDPAWTLFIQRYEPLLMAVARRLGLGDDDAQDLSQQTLLEFVRDLRAGRFDRQRGRMRTWILAIARNRSRDLLRRRGRRQAIDRQDSDDGAGATDPGSVDAEMEATWEHEMQRRIAREAFQRLRAEGSMADRTLQAFELTVVREVPPEAAAAECGMSVAQVYVARSRVASRLRVLIKEIEAAWAEDVSWMG